MPPSPSPSLPETSDEELVTRLAAGDAASLRELMQRYRGPLYGYLCRLLGSPEDADDLFQEAFLRVLRHADRFDPSRRLRPWLYSIATNLVKNAYRSRSYRDAVPLDRADDDDGDTLAAQLAERAATSPGDAAARAESARLVRRAVADLPERGRAALVLYYYQGLAYGEIAEVLGIPVGTVKSRIHNAVARLGRALDEEATT